jgi:hypothetical protein
VEKLKQMLGRTHGLRAVALELAGALLVIAGLHQVYEPAALVFAGAALVFIAQGMERGE